MDLFSVIAPPAVGATIGYTTNYIAVKMLFRPLKPVMIGRFHVPFTPGVVPKRKDELAGRLGAAVADQFWGADELEAVFLSDSFKSSVADRVAVLLDDPCTKLGFLDPDQPQKSEPLIRLKDELCVRINAAILKSDLKTLISEHGGYMIKERFGDGMVGKVLNKETLSAISAPLAEQIENNLLENGRAMLMPLIDEELRELSREPVANIVKEIMPDKNAVRAVIGNVYARFMKTHVRPIVESIDVGGMIAEKVRQMDAGDVEKLTLTVVNRELRYVIWLGAFIGALIGAVNIFI